MGRHAGTALDTPSTPVDRFGLCDYSLKGLSLEVGGQGDEGTQRQTLELRGKDITHLPNRCLQETIDLYVRYCIKLPKKKQIDSCPFKLQTC